VKSGNGSLLSFVITGGKLKSKIGYLNGEGITRKFFENNDLLPNLLYIIWKIFSRAGARMRY